MTLPNGLRVQPRAAWAAGLGHPGDLPAEAAGDVRVLLVHHSVSSNTYAPADVAAMIGSFHQFHTGPEKGWPDVAYNFFIDRFGGVWEGRAGSLERPVIGDATGGNQGFTQLVCLIGDFTSQPPSADAQASLVSLLDHLATTYGVSVGAGETASFTSRGSNRWAAGETVTAPTITGHRTMSRTACPGDAAFALVEGNLPSQVAAAAGAPSPTSTTTTTSTTTPASSTTASTSSSSPLATAPSPSPTTAEVTAPPSADGEGWSVAEGPLVVAGGAALAALGFVLRRRMQRP